MRHMREGRCEGPPRRCPLSTHRVRPRGGAAGARLADWGQMSQAEWDVAWVRNGGWTGCISLGLE